VDIFSDGPTRAQRAVLVVASVVLVGALLGAFLTSSLADGLLGRDDGDGGAAVDTRPDGSTTGSTAANGSGSSVPGATGTAPSTAAPSPTPAVPDAQVAVGIIRDLLQRCSEASGLLPEGIANLTYDPVPADTPTRFYVTVAEAPGATATFVADVGTRDVQGADQLAMDILAGCPAGQ
jgi:hypothetical protein